MKWSIATGQRPAPGYTYTGIRFAYIVTDGDFEAKVCRRCLPRLRARFWCWYFNRFVPRHEYPTIEELRQAAREEKRQFEAAMREVNRETA